MPRRQKTYLRTYVPGKDSDQPAHLRSQVRIFTEQILDRKGLNVSLSEQQRRIGCLDSSLGAHVKKFSL